MSEIIKKGFGLAVKPVVTIGITLLIGMVLIINAGESPIYAYGVLFRGAFGSANAFLGTLGKATPLIFTGLAAAVASTAGVFNIGIEGQMYLGALAAAVIGVNFGHLPPGILIPLCLAGAMAASCLWVMIPGFLNGKLGINIFILFFMLNNMAMLFTEFLANGIFKGNISEAATDRVAAGARFYRFSNYADVNVGIVLAVILVLVSWFVMKKTKFGYECSAMGYNRIFSEYIGIHTGRKTLLILAISAMIAGLAGAEQVMGSLGRFYANFSNNLGFTGISIGLLASNNPIGVLIFAIFFGALTSGGLQMAAETGISGDLIDVLQSLMILMVSGEFLIRSLKQSGKKILEREEA